MSSAPTAPPSRQTTLYFLSLAGPSPASVRKNSSGILVPRVSSLTPLPEMSVTRQYCIVPPFAGWIFASR
jgi:hypothetical protein